MNNDYLDPINSSRMPAMADSLFAMDFLLATKNGVRNCAYALTESATPEARVVLRKLLDEALELHHETAHLMMKKGWLHPYDLPEQHRLDVMSADTTVKIANLKLFPDHTSRLGTFADLDH